MVKIIVYLFDCPVKDSLTTHKDELLKRPRVCETDKPRLRACKLAFYPGVLVSL